MWALEYKINGDKAQGPASLVVATACVLSYVKWTSIGFVVNANYFGIIFDKNVTWRLHIEMIESKAFRTFIRVHSLF
jgi:hypothetical protein